MVTILLLFIVGPVVGGFAALPALMTAGPGRRSWSLQKRPFLFRAGLAGLGLFLLSPLMFGATVTVSALTTLAAICSSVCYKNDAGFRAWVERLQARAWLALQVLFYGKAAVDADDSDDEDGEDTGYDLNKRKPKSGKTAFADLWSRILSGRQSEPKKTEAPKPQAEQAQRQPAAQPVRAEAPKPQRPAPQAAPLRNCWDPRKWGQESEQELEATEAQVIQGLLVQMQKLQQAYLRPDSERQALQELVAATQRTEQSLREAVEQLKTGSVNWQDIKGHVDGLKQHELPAEVSVALEALLAQRASALQAGDASRKELTQQLLEKRDALAALQQKPLVTPEEAISGADQALAEAAEVNPPAQAQ